MEKSLLEELIVAQLVKKFLAFYDERRCITTLVTVMSHMIQVQKPHVPFL